VRTPLLRPSAPRALPCYRLRALPVRPRLCVPLLAFASAIVLATAPATAQDLPTIRVTGDVPAADPTSTSRDVRAAPDDRSATGHRRTAHVVVRAPANAGVIRVQSDFDSGMCRGNCSFDLVPGSYAVTLDQPRITGSTDIPAGRSFLYLRPSSGGLVTGGAVLLGLGIASVLVPFVGMAVTPWFLFTGIIAWPVALVVMIPGIVMLAISGPRVSVHDSDPDPPQSTGSLAPLWLPRLSF